MRQKNKTCESRMFDLKYCRYIYYHVPMILIFFSSQQFDAFPLLTKS